MANPQTEHGYVRIANEIWDEVIRRDFSKRHKDILLFIWRLSYGCRKKSAFIPMLKDFEICGIGKSNITKELNFLVESRVVDWDKETNMFTVIKDYERWQVNPVKGWNEDRFKKLISENIEKSLKKPIEVSYQNDNFESEVDPVKITVSYQNNNWKVIKTITSRLSKRELRGGSNPCRCRVKRVSKDSIKDSIKKRSIRSSMEDDFSFSKIYKAYEKNFTDGKIKEFDVDEINILFDDYGGEWLLKAMRESYLAGPDKRNLKYVRGTLKGYRERGGLDGSKPSPVNDSPKETYLSRRDRELEELRRDKEEAKRLEAIGSD